MLRRQLTARIALPAISAVLLLAGAAALTGCGSTIPGTPQAVSGNPGKPPGKTGPGGTTTPGAPAAPTTTARADKGGNTDFQASIGDCVKLGGTTDNATIVKEPCGSQDANYKVIGKAPSNTQCPKDVDQAYYETLNGIETGALCLDVDWVVGDCFDVGGDDPHRIPCGTPGVVDGVHVLAILPNSTSLDDCTVGDSGYVYRDRRTVVCVGAL